MGCQRPGAGSSDQENIKNLEKKAQFSELKMNYGSLPT